MAVPIALKARGAFYTSRTAAEYMVRWAVRDRSDVVLEPCFGDGAFLEPLAEHVEQHRIFGVEIDKAIYDTVLHRKLLLRSHAHLGDFMATEPGKGPFKHLFTTVVGNPPYVRLRKLAKPVAERALQIAADVMGEPMNPSGSLWMPFVLQACRFLRRGGRFALVLPYELTYVKYARPLWRYMSDNFEYLRCVRVHDRLFPDLSQDVVLLFADGFGGTTAVVTYETYPDLHALLQETPLRTTEIQIADVLAGDRPFLKALLPPALNDLMASPRVAEHVTTLGRVSRFSIGYVTGHKEFFHLSREKAQSWGIPPQHLKPAITNGRELKGIGIYTTSIPKEQWVYLYDPPADESQLTTSDLRYLAEGEASEVHKRYKCRVRKPWYKVPGLEEPDLLLSVFSDLPFMVRNDGRFLASNSLLCGKVANGLDPTVVAGSWYNSLTLLSCEIEVHSLGGGVMILIPGEANKVLVPRLQQVPKYYLEALDRLLRHAHGIDHAFALGDSVLLEGQLGLTRQEISLVRDGVDTLRYWRKGNIPDE